MTLKCVCRQATSVQCNRDLLLSWLSFLIRFGECHDGEVDFLWVASHELLADLGGVGQEGVSVGAAMADGEVLAAIELEQFIVDIDKGDEVIGDDGVGWWSGGLTFGSEVLVDVDEVCVFGQQLAALFR
jgi:hypothetical protein